MKKVAHLRRVADEVVQLDHVEHCRGRRAGERVAPERRAVIAGFEDVRSRIGQARADGQPAAQSLGERHHVRRRPRVLMCEPPAGAAEPCLYLVEDEQQVLFVAPFAHALQVAGRRWDDADLAHHGLEHHCDRFARGRRLDRAEVVVRHVDETAGQRLERIRVLVLPPGRHRGKGSSVKRARRADDLESAFAIPRAPFPRELDRGFIRLSAGVAEEDSRWKRQLDEAASQLDLGLGEVEV